MSAINNIFGLDGVLNGWEYLADISEWLSFDALDKGELPLPVWHWSGYGVVCPSIWLTHGSYDFLSKVIMKALRSGWLQANDSKWNIEAYEEMETKLMEASNE